VGIWRFWLAERDSTHAIGQLYRSGNMFVVKEQNEKKLFIIREQLRIFMTTTFMQRIWRGFQCQATQFRNIHISHRQE
jgi:hypothetical protein